MGRSLRFPALAVSVAAANLGSAQEADSLACTFTAECVGTERPCHRGDPLAVVLRREGDGWMMTGDSDVAIPFDALAGDRATMLSLISTRSDPSAAAVTLLSVAADGAAFVSTHGIFLTPAAVLHVGTCTPVAR